MAQTGAVTFEPLQGLSGVVAAASFESATATGASSSAGSTVAASGLIQFRTATAAGEGSAGSVAAGDASFEETTAAGYCPMSTDISFEAMTAAGTSLTGTVASASPRFAPLTASVTNVSVGMAAGAAAFRAATASAAGAEANVGRGVASFRRPYGLATSLNGTVASGAAELALVTVAASGHAVGTASGSASFYTPVAAGLGRALLTDSRTWVLNVGNDALTEYQNYDFDGYASYNGAYYAAGPSGIYQLAGADDDGTDISWSFRTPLMDDKKPGLKRLEEVLVAMKYDGPVRVRIWTDNNRYFDYNISSFRPGVIQQVRAQVGKGLRSRYFRVALYGVGSTSAEVLSLQVPMLQINRRIG